MTNKAEYLYYARECSKWAGTAKNPEERQAFLEMADAWTRVALVQEDVTKKLLPRPMTPSGGFIVDPPQKPRARLGAPSFAGAGLFPPRLGPFEVTGWALLL